MVGVDPQDAAIVYVATIESSGPPNPGDRLYRSNDGGATFAEVLVTTNAITDVLVRGASVIVATKVGGFTSTDRGVTFVNTSEIEKELLATGADAGMIAAVRARSVKPAPTPAPIPVATPTPADFYAKRADASLGTTRR